MFIAYSDQENETKTLFH